MFSVLVLREVGFADDEFLVGDEADHRAVIDVVQSRVAAIAFEFELIENTRERHEVPQHAKRIEILLVLRVADDSSEVVAAQAVEDREVS